MTGGRKDQFAVSPVIATILMVAITVVLAAVLYVLVSGFLIVNKDPKIIGIACVLTPSDSARCEIVSPDTGVDFQSVTVQVTTSNGSIVLDWPSPVSFGLNATGSAQTPVSYGRVVDNGDGNFGIGDDIYIVPVSGMSLKGLTVKASGPGANGAFTI
ncbi:MAG TPA: archaellin/type IV pilin N-terminal domain-containing protein [Thermoplasmata archaeon]|nr:archaellin/type IV pilin N-terminal domain-containing protein [Thermoplasmata archaeon]